ASPTLPPPTPPRRVRAAAVVAPLAPLDSDDEPDDEPVEATEVDPNAHLTVPVGEFDHGATPAEPAKLRISYEQSTMKRDAATALLGMPEAPLTVVKETPVEMLLDESAAQLVRGDPTNIDPTARFERGDPTLGPDATSIDAPHARTGAPGGKLRTQAALRRKRGIGGDVRYVATALFGVRRARREIAALETQQAARQKERARHLLTLGRAAAVADGYDHPALNRAREQLGDIEDERARHAAQVTAADSELLRVRNDRDFKIKQHLHDVAKLDAALADVTKKLEPLEKEATAVARRAAALHESLRRIDAQIAATEASKVAVNKSKLDPASIQAELATLKADRQSVTREEPVMAAELDALNPRIAALVSARSEARKQKIELETAEQEDQRRAAELLAAIGAKRKVVDRAASDAEALRDKILLELGERIYVDRPASMTAQLSPVDSIDVELGTSDRRLMELREILSSVDKAKLARGIAVIVLVLAAVGSLVAWLIYLFG
ncbi:MAG: hypothetical protein M3680_17315, partial [Myxococcota bacterium]|nr:hypothetical protein [Myxococcota bacterium]